MAALSRYPRSGLARSLTLRRFASVPARAVRVVAFVGRPFGRVSVEFLWLCLDAMRHRDTAEEVILAAEEWAEHILSQDGIVVDDPVEQRLLSAVLLHRGRLADLERIPKPPKNPSFDSTYGPVTPTNPYTSKERCLIALIGEEDEDTEAPDGQ